MGRLLHRLAIILWAMSFVAPAAYSDKGYVLGLQVLWASVVMLMAAFPFTLLLVLPPFAIASNFIFAREVFRCVVGARRVQNSALVGSAAFLNTVSVMFFMSEAMTKARPWYMYPAAYLWLSSFCVLWLSTKLGLANAEQTAQPAATENEVYPFSLADVPTVRGLPKTLERNPMRRVIPAYLFVELLACIYYGWSLWIWLGWKAIGPFAFPGSPDAGRLFDVAFERQAWACGLLAGLLLGAIGLVCVFRGEVTQARLLAFRIALVLLPLGVILAGGFIEGRAPQWVWPQGMVPR